MKKFLKLVTLPAAMFLLATSVTSCSPSQKIIAMISDVGDVDDGSFNQGTWEAVRGFGQEHNISYDYYRPFADSDFARECAIKQAIVKGAKIIVMPGFKFSLNNFAYKMAEKYPNQHFMLLDAVTDDTKTTNNNLVCVSYNFTASGWLAGYSTAKDYMLTDLANNKKFANKYSFGFCGGMSNGGVYPYGLGFIQGILYAAREMTAANPSLSKPKMEINYNYAGVFAQDDGACARVKGWIGAGTKCVFSCGGKLYQSITEAVKEYNRLNGYADFKDQHAPRNCARWIGVDADQYTLVQDQDEVKSIYTSALKDVGKTVKIGLSHEFNIPIKVGEKTATGKWSDLCNDTQCVHNLGLKSDFGVAKDEVFVGIPESFKADGTMRCFNYFNKKQYDEIYQKLIPGPNQIILCDGYPYAPDPEKPKEKVTEYGEKEGFPTFFNKGKSYYPVSIKNKGIYYNGTSASSSEYDNFEVVIQE